ncbi:MAG: cytochrome C [Nitrospirae bacterium]|jgi:hypothetical protein|nr:cytochrome C [Nitrospirota bacterium]
MKQKKIVLLTGCTLLLLLVIIACAAAPVAPPQSQQPPMQVAAAPQTPPAQQPVVEPPKPSPKPKDVYEMEISPLTPADCARCHPGVFNEIKGEGGKHKFDCQKCHTKFHQYNPVKQNWNEIMPQCKTCHGLIHGEKFAACATCHSNPHAPKTQMTMSAEMSKVCGDCHTKVGQEVKTNVSKHTNVACSSCHHDKHGYIPSCMECHKPHTSTLTVKECLACHPVHSPLKISYPISTVNDICGSCHGVVYGKLKANASKHSTLTCASCHTKHRFIPKCEDCHSKPHGEALLKKFPNCADCHVGAHDLPSKSISK